MNANRFSLAVVLIAVAPIMKASSIGAPSPSAAPVQEVEYTFFAQLGGNEAESAQFIVPDFVSSDVTIPFTQIVSCQIVGVPCGSVTLQPDETLQGIGTYDTLSLNPEDGTGLGYIFPVHAFQAFGTYFDNSGTALLSIQSVEVFPAPPPAPDPTPTPEPYSIGLALAGGSLLCWSVRARCPRADARFSPVSGMH
jgi:hypothetical protein